MKPINKDILDTWEQKLTAYEQIPHDDHLNSAVQKIYLQCKEIKRTQGELLSSDMSLKAQFTEIEKRVHDLFCKSSAKYNRHVILYLIYLMKDIVINLMKNIIFITWCEPC